jgi:hypothetical protein
LATDCFLGFFSHEHGELVPLPLAVTDVIVKDVFFAVVIVIMRCKRHNNDMRVVVFQSIKKPTMRPDKQPRRTTTTTKV